MGDIARWAALAAGFPDHVPAYTVNRFCASSLTATIGIAHAIGAGEISLGLAAGVESMSRSGWAMMKGDAAFMPRGPVFMLDTMWAGAGGPPNPALLARDAYIEMIKTAQNLATRYEIPREEIDAFALRSHRTPPRPATAAASRRRSSRSRCRPDARARRGRFEHDESIRDDTTLERLAALPAAAGHREHDGRQLEPALRRRERRRARERRGMPSELGATPIARILASAAVGVDPAIMGIAPAYALPRAIQQAGLTADQIDVYEIHEAFAAQVLAVLREFRSRRLRDPRRPPEPQRRGGRPRPPVRRLRHALRAHARDRAARARPRYGAIGVCVGSGQGVALVIENTQADS